MNTKPENYLKEYDSQRNNIDYYLSEHLGMNTLHKEVEWTMESQDKSIMPSGGISHVQWTEPGNS